MAAGSFSNLYRGYYCGQEVAVKILKELQDDASQFQEFLQEVSIMRKVGSHVLWVWQAGELYQVLTSLQTVAPSWV